MEVKSFETMYRRLGEIVKEIQKTDISIDAATEAMSAVASNNHKNA